LSLDKQLNISNDNLLTPYVVVGDYTIPLGKFLKLTNLALKDNSATGTTDVTINLASDALDGGSIDSVALYDGGYPYTSKSDYLNNITGGTP
jgi:hypothetical protein